MTTDSDAGYWTDEKRAFIKDFITDETDIEELRRIARAGWVAFFGVAWIHREERADCVRRNRRTRQG